MTYEELDSLKDDSRLSSIEKENIKYLLKYWVDIITVSQLIKKVGIKWLLIKN